MFWIVSSRQKAPQMILFTTKLLFFRTNEVKGRQLIHPTIWYRIKMATFEPSQSAISDGLSTGSILCFPSSTMCAFPLWVRGKIDENVELLKERIVGDIYGELLLSGELLFCMGFVRVCEKIERNGSAIKKIFVRPLCFYRVIEILFFSLTHHINISIRISLKHNPIYEILQSINARMFLYRT